MATLHAPEAQRWNLVPSMQFQAPSLLHAPVWAPTGVPLPPVGAGKAMLVEVAAGTEVEAGTEEAGTEDVEAEDAAAEDEAGTETDVVAVMRVVGVTTVVKKTVPLDQEK